MIVKLSSFLPTLKKALNKPLDRKKKKASDLPPMSYEYGTAVAILSRLPDWFFAIVVKAVLEIVFYRIAILAQEGSTIATTSIRTRWKSKNKPMNGSYYADGKIASREYKDLAVMQNNTNTTDEFPKRYKSPVRHLKRKFLRNGTSPKIDYATQSFCCSAFRIINYPNSISIKVFVRLLMRHTVKSIVGNLKSKRARQMGIQIWYKGHEVNFVRDLQIYIDCCIDNPLMLVPMNANLEKSREEYKQRSYTRTKFTEKDWEEVAKHRGVRTFTLRNHKMR